MSTIAEALEALKTGKMVILVDDEDRENEGDIVFPAEKVTDKEVNFLVTHARGLVCLAMESKRIEELELPMMTHKNQSPRQTAFTVSVEAKDGISTGISAKDRARTIQVAVDPKTGPEDLVSPGHVFPLKAMDGGVLVRAGHTEGSLDLMRLAGLQPAAMICEIMNQDGTMARREDLLKFADKHGKLPVVTIQDLISYRMERESLVEEIATSRLPTEFGEFKLHAFLNKIDGSEHFALSKGEIKDPTLVRVHSQCFTGDSLLSLRCDCGAQLRAAMKQISEDGGILVYMQRHEGRGIGLLNKIRAYQVQDELGMDTVEANRHLGFKADLRHYGIGAQILRKLGVKRLNLLTNNPKKVVGLNAYGLSIEKTLPIEVGATKHNVSYLTTKRDKMGHRLDNLPN